jgi:cobalt-zinc-cadmium efflux system outer membrane protein
MFIVLRHLRTAAAAVMLAWLLLAGAAVVCAAPGGTAGGTSGGSVGSTSAGTTGGTSPGTTGGTSSGTSSRANNSGPPAANPGSPAAPQPGHPKTSQPATSSTPAGTTATPTAAPSAGGGASPGAPGAGASPSAPGASRATGASPSAPGANPAGAGPSTPDASPAAGASPGTPGASASGRGTSSGRGTGGAAPGSSPAGGGVSPGVAPGSTATPGTTPTGIPTAGPVPSILGGVKPAGPELTLTLDKTLQLALSQNKGYQVAQAQAKEAYWAWKAAGKLQAANITLNYIGGNDPNATTNGISQDWALAFGQSFGPIRSTYLAGMVARFGYEMALLSAEQTRVTLVQNVKDAFYGLLLAQEQLAVARDNMELANHILNVAAKRFTAGAGPKVDLLNAQIQRAQTVQALIQAESGQLSAQNTLAPLLNLPAHQPLKAEGLITLPVLTATYEQLLSTAQQANPSILQAQKTLEQARYNVMLARSQANPTPGISYQNDLSNTQFYFFGATLAFPIDWGAIKYNVRQQQSTVQEKQFALDNAVTAVTAAVKTAFDNFRAAAQNASTYRAEVLEPSEQLMKATQLGFTYGALPYLNVLNAQQTLRQARAQYLTLLLTGFQAHHALEAAVGHAFDETGGRP